MRISFNDDDPDAIVRLKARRKVGRKHNHQPRGRAHQKMLMRPILRERWVALARKKFKARVAAFWRGEVENHP